MEAPAEIRGEFSSIRSVVPGMDVCELLPKLAGVMDRCSVIRSVVGQRDEHSSFQSLTGYSMREVERNQYPNFGSVVSKCRDRQTRSCRRLSIFFRPCSTDRTTARERAQLGSQYNQVRADGEDLASMKVRVYQIGSVRQPTEVAEWSRQFSQSGRPGRHQ